MDIKNLLVLKHAIKDFSELKDDDDGGYPILIPLDTDAIELLRDINAGGLLHNPLQVESLLDVAVQHLNVCL
jgi:hypothetical protein